MQLFNCKTAKKTGIYSFLISTLFTNLALSQINDATRFDGLSPDHMNFTPPTEVQDPYKQTSVNPYNNKPLVKETNKTIVAFFNKSTTIQIPVGNPIFLSIKQNNNKKNLKVLDIQLTKPDEFEVSRDPATQTITFISKLQTNYFDSKNKNDNNNPAILTSLARIITPIGTLMLKLETVPNGQAPESYNLMLNEQGIAFNNEEPAKEGPFNYNQNPSPVTPYTGDPYASTEAQNDGNKNEFLNTDKVSKSPEAAPFNPYLPNNGGTVSLYKQGLITAPEITTELVPTAISMMRRYEIQKSAGATDDQKIQRKIISQPYQLTQEQTVTLGEAYRFPKYQTTAIRITWKNNTTTAHYLNPLKTAIRIGNFVHTPQRYAQARNVVYPGQVNELYLFFQIPNAELEQNYQLILPSDTAPIYDAGPQTRSN
jgi:hypothetical protein